ncbi:uncharacterized protein LOC111489609 [Cucurbita maxima]|uniref:Uncharacterized protein LOC111489609 n=1 Tax=Cucurbita maxima TaxID=3661 RepID=A0A6J1JTK8_CUCMA|nr:uncharacterized protein LOC111489609 [Cucurbita maxima]
MTPKTYTLTNLRTRTKRSLPDSAVRAPNPHEYGETTSSSPCSSSSDDDDDDDVSAKLEALQSLIPAQSAEARQTEQLFKETADYIVLLKTQVVILQKLVDFFGSAVLS